MHVPNSIFCRKRKRHSAVTSQSLVQKKVDAAAAIPESTSLAEETGEDARTSLNQRSCHLSPVKLWKERTGGVEEEIGGVEEQQKAEEEKQRELSLKYATGATSKVEIDELLFSIGKPEVGQVPCAGPEVGQVPGTGPEVGRVPYAGVLDDGVAGRTGATGEGTMVNSVGVETMAEDEGLGVLSGLYPEDFSFSLDSSIHMRRPSLTDPCSVGGRHVVDPVVTSVENAEVAGDSMNSSTSPDGRAPVVPNEPVDWGVNSIPESPISSPILPPELSEVPLPHTPSLPPVRATSTPFKAPAHVQYPSTFYGLPLLVQTLLVDHRGIKNLYGKGCQ